MDSDHRDCDDPECVAKQLLDLETHTKWKTVSPALEKRRDSWVNECKSASGDGAVARLLLEFEENVGWKAVDEEWKARRAGWVAELKGE